MHNKFKTKDKEREGEEDRASNIPLLLEREARAIAHNHTQTQTIGVSDMVNWKIVNTHTHKYNWNAIDANETATLLRRGPVIVVGCQLVPFGKPALLLLTSFQTRDG